MIEKNTVIIDLKDYDELKEQLYHYEIKEKVAKFTSELKDKITEELVGENKKLKVRLLTDWLQRNYAQVTQNGNDFEWRYDHINKEFHEFVFDLNASLEVAEIALNDYIESQKGEEDED